MDKKAIINAISEHIDRAIINFEKQIDELKGTSDLDETETKDPEDFSQQAVSTDMQLRLKTQVDKLKNERATLQTYIGTTREVISAGAVFETAQKYFLVGISGMGVQFNNKDIVGFSTEAPIFESLEGKQKGDLFVMGEEEYTILNIA